VREKGLIGMVCVSSGGRGGGARLGMDVLV
jgi:hypothetical protein